MAQENLLQQFERKFRVQELLIKEFGFWLWSLRPVQCTLGFSILCLKRHALKLSDVQSHEMSELAVVIPLLEKGLLGAFGFDKINYLMLMMVDPHVHFHVIPRYDSVRSFEGREWTDQGWPGIPILAGEDHDKAILRRIVQQIKRQIVS